MAKKSTLQVKGTTIRTLQHNGIDYICITDIARQKNPAEPKDVSLARKILPSLKT